jgi:hypothetical protein
MTSQESPEQPTRSLPPWWVFGGPLAVVLVILVVLTSIFWLDTETQSTTSTNTSTEVSPTVPEIDYRALIALETSKAKTQTDAIVKGHQASLATLDQSYATRFSRAADSAAEHAATYTSIAKLIGYLAWDTVKSTSEAESYLNTLIDPSVTPELTDFHNVMNAEAAKYDNELRKVTVQLAANIAAIGPGNAPPPPRLDSQEGTSRDYQKILTTLGLKGTLTSVQLASNLPDFTGKSILPKLTKPIRVTAVRMFAKQIAKVAALPVIASATGPIPIGLILAGIGALSTVHDIYKLRPDFQVEVYQMLGTNLIEIRIAAISQLSKSALMKSQEIKKIQLDIGARALDDFTKQEAK